MVPFNAIPAPGGDPKLIEELQTASVTYRFERPPNPVGGILLNLLPLVLLGGFWYMAYQRAAASGGPGGIFGVGKSKAIVVKPEDVTVAYKDVGGADEATFKNWMIFWSSAMGSSSHPRCLFRRLLPLRFGHQPVFS